MDEETFQSTMKYIFTFIEKVNLPIQPETVAMLMLEPDPAGKTSRKHCRETLPAIPTHGGASAVAGYRVLFITFALQVREVPEEAY